MNNPIRHLLPAAAALAALLLLSACIGSRTPPPHLYTLAPTTVWDTFADRDISPDAPRIDIQPIVLPRHLDRPQLVTLRDKTPDSELVFNEFHRWGTPLDASIRELLAARLLDRLPSTAIDPRPAVSTSLSSPAAAAITVEILRMEGAPGDGIDLIARWEIIFPATPTRLPVRRLAHYRAISESDTIPAYVDALRSATTALADDLAAHIDLPPATAASPTP